MLRDAFEFLTGIGEDRSKVNLVSLGSRRRLLVHGRDKSEIEIDPPVRLHHVETVGSLTKAVEAFGEEYVSVFVGAGEVRVLLDDTTRDDCVVLALEESKQLRTLRALCQPLPQRELIAALRHELAGTFDPRFLAIIRRLDFSRNGGGRSTLDHGKESMGRSVETAVQSAEGELPETVHFEIPLLKTPADFFSERTIHFAVDVDPVKELFSLHPEGDSIEDELKGALDSLAAKIDEATPDKVTVLRGIA